MPIRFINNNKEYKGVVAGIFENHVGKNHQRGSAIALNVGGAACCLKYSLRHKQYGIHFDKERNLVRSDQPRMISTEDSPVKVFVVPTNEELAIAQKSAEIAAMAREAGLYK